MTGVDVSYDYDCTTGDGHFDAVSQCCGSGEHSDVEGMCSGCGEFTGWEGSVCGEDMDDEVYS